MALNRDKFRSIVGGITTPEKETPTTEISESSAAITTPEPVPSKGQGGSLPVPMNQPRR